jgi:hydrogenase maturation factor
MSDPCTMSDADTTDEMPENSLPVGKIPSQLLGRLLAGMQLTDQRVIVGPGIGRDAAVIDLGDRLLVAKTDPITFATDESPRYLVNVNANDLACVGAQPRWMMVTALFPENRTTESLISGLFAELIEACRERGITLIGGHTEITAGLDRPILIGMLLGESTRERLLAPGRAHPGDRIMVVGPIAVEGTALIAKEFTDELAMHFDVEFVERCANLLYEPGISIVDQAETLLGTGGVSALHDPTEGGLASGIRELGMASDCGAVINRALVPVMPETQLICDHFGMDPLGMLASGSLLAAVHPDRVSEVERSCLDRGYAQSVIGKLTVPDRDFTMIVDGQSHDLPLFAADEVARLFASRGDSVKNP